MTAPTAQATPGAPWDPTVVPAKLTTDPKIQSRHLGRQALIYVRQSDPYQVRRHPESARRQYGLAERAAQFGWPPEQIRVIDEDQGKTAAGSAAAHGREGFAQLVSAVGLGEVGIVLALEVSRLARNSAEWYRLLELAALSGTLIADDASIYDPRLFNDRLLLGLRGTISEVELHCIQERLQGARMSKARRGELPLRLPAGYVTGGDGQIEFDPDQEVQRAIRTIFDQFERLGSGSAVLRFFNDYGLKIPRRRWHSQTVPQIVWMRPSYQAIHLVLTNPIYAGAYVYGQRGHDPSGAIGVGSSGPRRRFALDQVEVLLHDHHPAYLSWERYLAHRAALRDNASQFTSSRGAPGRGASLLQGLVVCGRCGCRMQVQYSVPSPAYICSTRHRRYGEPICQSVTIDHVDRAVTEAFLQVIGPAQVEAALALAEDLERDRAIVERQWQLRLERAQYEAERAARQYDAVEPENRLVARELESRWNEKLRALAELEGEYRQQQARGLAPLTAEERTMLSQLVSDLPALWSATETTMEERKGLVRCLIDEIVLLRDDRANGTGGVTTIRIGWRGPSGQDGAWSELQVRRPSSGEAARTPESVLDRIRLLAQQHPDDQVAALLNAEGLQTRQGLAWTFLRVGQVRRVHSIPTACPTMPKGTAPRGDGLVPVSTVAAHLGVAPSAVGDWCRWGLLAAERKGPHDPLWIRWTEEDRARLDGRHAAKGHHGWRLREAQRELGLSKEELYQRVRQGELVAYRAHVGDHWEWRVRLACQAQRVLPPPQRPSEPIAVQAE